jgi:hypothetical protein
VSEAASSRHDDDQRDHAESDVLKEQPETGLARDGRCHNQRRHRWTEVARRAPPRDVRNREEHEEEQVIGPGEREVDDEERDQWMPADQPKRASTSALSLLDLHRVHHRSYRLCLFGADHPFCAPGGPRGIDEESAAGV